MKYGGFQFDIVSFLHDREDIHKLKRSCIFLNISLSWKIDGCFFIVLEIHWTCVKLL